MPVWCGGMLETGIGRAHNVQLASLPNFRLPGDVSASNRYFDTELIAEPALTQLFQGDAWELGRNIHPHPTLSEAVMEAAMAVDGHAIHF